MINVLNSIVLENYRGIKKKEIILNNCTPGKIQIIVGRNGCGKTTITQAFEYANTNKLECKTNDFYNCDQNLVPSLKVVAHLNDQKMELTLDTKHNTIKDYFRTHSLWFLYHSIVNLIPSLNIVVGFQPNSFIALDGSIA